MEKNLLKKLALAFLLFGMAILLFGFQKTCIALDYAAMTAIVVILFKMLLDSAKQMIAGKN